MIRWTLRLIFAGAVMGLPFITAGCAWRVTPPSGLHDPVPVFLTDYGRHTRLGLPEDDQRVVEFGFGEWHYYAHEERGFFSTLRAVSGFGQGTLARRHLPYAESEELFGIGAGGQRSVRFLVEGEKVRELRRSLERKWRQNLDGMTYREWEDLYFVPYDATYHLFRNSNHQTAEWLEALGCEVGGVPILSNFRLREPP